ncbi:U6 snRNA-associated Sm-like protein LSm8 [Yarrowia sp. C11]|nr:U6 snRNA-associated Sm-like protein LSm8 [Yarrowia sp. E02]KAG5373069.1 U6 snRNA-associated Sm-like protein LSm8 [Yarrowia sp. C11]
MSALSGYINKPVTVITTDGRLILGILQGYDQATNVILSNTRERVITPDEPTEVVDLGLYMLRGDCIACVGETDLELDGSIQWNEVRGEELGDTRRNR